MTTDTDDTTIDPHTDLDRRGRAILTAIRALADDLDTIPTTADFREHTTHSLPAVYARWDSWANALRDAGVTDVTTSHSVGRND